MLYVQFDSQATAAAAAVAPDGVQLVLRVCDLHDTLDGLELRGTEPAIALFRFGLSVVLGDEAVSAAGWRDRGVDTRRGFSLVLGDRRADGRWPVGLAAYASAPELLVRWLASRGLDPHIAGDVVSCGLPAAATALSTPLLATLATDHPYGQVLVRLRGGNLWGAMSRRGTRFQAELVAQLSGLAPLHVIARDPPEDVAEVIPPDRVPPIQLGRDPSPRIEQVGPPSWDEPGPCDCGVPPDLCAMKRFRLVPVDGAPPSALPGADMLRQLSAAIVDLHLCSSAASGGEFRAGDRVLVSRSPESRAMLGETDLVLDREGTVRPLSITPRDSVVGAVLMALPWPPDQLVWTHA